MKNETIAAKFQQKILFLKGASLINKGLDIMSDSAGEKENNWIKKTRRELILLLST